MADGNLVIEAFADGNGLSYLIGDRGAGTYAILDPYESLVPTCVEAVRKRGGKIKFVLETHLHEDHLSGTPGLKRETGCEVVAGQGHMGRYVDRRLGGGVRVRIGAITLNVMATPGHAADAISYAGPGFVFTGDTLLVGGCGRTDLPGSDPGALYASLKKLTALPDDTVVWPGKAIRGGRSSTIGKEREANPLLQLQDGETFVAHLKALTLPAPMNAKYYILCNERGHAEDPSDLPVDSASKLWDTGSCTLIDVGSLDQHQEMRIEGSVSIPVEELAHRWREIVKGVPPLVVVSGSPGIALQAKSILEEKGFLGVRCLKGGLREWKASGFPIFEKKRGLKGFRTERFLLGSLAMGAGIAGLAHGSPLGWAGVFAGAILGIELALGKDLASMFK